MQKNRNIPILPLTAQAFAPFGEVIETDGAQNFTINNGLCTRYHDLAKIEFSGEQAHPMISIVTGECYQLPLTLPMVERHPLGSQAFIPLSNNPFLIVVCDVIDGEPGKPRAFITSAQQGINIRQNIWHGILTPLENVSTFLVIDRGGKGNNLEEHFFETPFIVGA